MAVKLDDKIKATDSAEFEYPKVFDTPKGWPNLFGMDGDSWYQRALNVERISGRPVLPSKYIYDDDGNVIDSPYYKEENGK